MFTANATSLHGQRQSAPLGVITNLYLAEKNRSSAARTFSLKVANAAAVPPFWMNVISFSTTIRQSLNVTGTLMLVPRPLSRTRVSEIAGMVGWIAPPRLPARLRAAIPEITFSPVASPKGPGFDYWNLGLA